MTREMRKKSRRKIRQEENRHEHKKSRDERRGYERKRDEITRYRRKKMGQNETKINETK